NERASDGGNVLNYSGDIIWIAREQPLRGVVQGKGDQDLNFDMPGNLMRLETRLIFWYPMRIPFANWVMSKMFLANFKLQAYRAQNPLMLTQQANWNGSMGSPTFNLDTAIGAEMAARVNRGEFVFPIQATYTMRMMTPAKAVNFTTQNCPPTPSSL
ncbi:MAG: TadE/TadG family type IV pilus assembly protein, partial [Myxococcaceae bacterium]